MLEHGGILPLMSSPSRTAAGTSSEALQKGIDDMKEELQVIKAGMYRILAKVESLEANRPSAPPQYDSGMYPKLNRPAYMGGPKM